MYKLFITLAVYATQLGFVMSTCSALKLGSVEHILAATMFSLLPFALGGFAAKSVLLEK